MENCYNEFVEHVDGKKVICAEIAHDDNYGDNKREFKLRVGHSPDEFEEFLKSLNFNYDDGSEWWVHNVCPEIPQSLKKTSDHA